MRSDGRRVKSISFLQKTVPYIMPQRNDGTNLTQLEFPYSFVMKYINEQRKKGDTSITLMACMIAAYVRTIAKHPEINRFAISKKIYARKGIWVSFVTLKGDWSGEGERDETVVKIEFKGDETISEISKKVNEEIEKNRAPDNKNSMDRFLSSLFSIPLLPSFIVSLIKGLDKLGLMPSPIIKLSPFHSSIFISNMASIRANPIYHHIYNFGSTSAFISLGIDLANRRKYQMYVATDERICNGSSYVRAMRYFMSNLCHPEYLESRPEKVNEDVR